MNKKIHIISFLLLLFFICYLCRDKIVNLIEPFGNQIVIHHDDDDDDDDSLNSEEVTIPVLTYDNNINSGYIQGGICSDDNRWKNGNKNCRDYSLVGSNCDDIGDDGNMALDMCKVACDNCLNYEEIKMRDETDDGMGNLDVFSSGEEDGEPVGDTISFTYDGGINLQYDLTVDYLNIRNYEVINRFTQSIIDDLNNRPNSRILCGSEECIPELLNINT